MELTQGDALVIVDVQNDFLPGGSLPVPHGDEVLVPLNRYIELFHRRRLSIIATRDWHPNDHCSFVDQGGPWPAHCRQGTFGAEFARALRLPDDVLVIDKATDSRREDFSGFTASMELELRERDIERLFIGGLATDYCVLRTALDALHRGYGVVVLEDAIRAIDRRPGDGAAACQTMRQTGALFLRLKDFNI